MQYEERKTKYNILWHGGGREGGVVGRKDQIDKKEKEAFLALRVCAKLYILGKFEKKEKRSFLALKVCAKLYILGKFEKKEKIKHF